jgi:hypothetical protein
MKTKSFGNERLKCLFSQVQGDSDLQNIFERIPLSKKRATRKKAIVIMMIEKSERIGKFWMDGKILHLIAL